MTQQLQQPSPYSCERVEPTRAIVAHPGQILLVLDHDGRRVPTVVELHQGDEIDVVMPDPSDPARLELVGLHRGQR